ncbi:MAG: hypothetical protein UY07_C0006G0011 [Parcubacteria group bacterium GW2011_GWA1_47_8]|nr:MAG: hypothetical protein UY07_C0006G0011 [Parcubacteria group bacterium GW2011_GWA1_47_8]
MKGVTAVYIRRRMRFLSTADFAVFFETTTDTVILTASVLYTDKEKRGEKNLIPFCLLGNFARSMRFFLGSMGKYPRKSFNLNSGETFSAFLAAARQDIATIF